MSPIFRNAVPVFLTIALLCCRAGSEEENPELDLARTAFEKEMEFSTRPIRDRYVSRLETLKRTLGSRGDARGAAAVQDEIDRVRNATPAQGSVAKFVGKWKVSYNVGSVRTYAISADGQVTQDEHDGTPPKTGKLIVKGNDVLLDLNQAWIERLRVNGKTLTVDHFNPKALYPAGQPNAKGTGTLQAGH